MKIRGAYNSHMFCVPTRNFVGKCSLCPVKIRGVIKNMDIDKLIYECVGAAMQVYSHLGPGLLECVYEKALIHELKSRNLSTSSQNTVEFVYKGVTLDTSLRLDIIVEDTLIFELKAVDTLQPMHFKQLRTYMKLLNKPVGILVNFDVCDFSKGYKVLR